MSSLIVTGGRPISGEIWVQGSKNAALPLLAASLLIKGTTVLEHCPDISDVTCMLDILKEVGCTVLRDRQTVIIDAKQLKQSTVPKHMAEQMRSSISLLGALLGREASAQIPLPGGCSIGRRPVDIHLEALCTLGAKIEEGEEIHARLSGCNNARIIFPYPSVGAVQNVILASAVSDAQVILENCAREPEVEELCLFLNLAGADIRGGGTGTITVHGVKSLHEVRYTVRSDRIAAGTVLAMAAATQGAVTVRGIEPSELFPVTEAFGKIGCQVRCYEREISLRADRELYALPFLETMPYPGFPTDMQSQLMSVLIFAKGSSTIRETVFENRFGAASELRKLHADIEVDHHAQLAVIRGRERKSFCPASMTAPDLRAGAALVTAALAVEGTSVIHKSEYVERGYENMAQLIDTLGGSCKASYD